MNSALFWDDTNANGCYSIEVTDGEQAGYFVIKPYHQSQLTNCNYPSAYPQCDNVQPPQGGLDFTCDGWIAGW